MKPWSAWQDWVKAVAGVWLFISPWILGTTYDGSSSWNSWIFGALILAAALWGLAAPKAQWTRWLSGLFGLWVLVSPVLILVETTLVWNAVVTGAVTIILSVWLLAQGQSGQTKVSA